MQNNIKDLIQDEFNKISLKQQDYYELLKLEFEVFNLGNNVERIEESNRNLEQQIRKYNSEIEYYKSRIHRLSQEQQYYLKEYNKILHSNSWRLMAPLRGIGKFSKKFLGR